MPADLTTLHRKLRMTYVLILANLKGGVAKTTTSIELAFHLAMAGLNVLVIDIDTDVCSTEALDITPEKEGADIYRLLTNPKQGIADIVQTYAGTDEHPIDFPSCFHVIPGSDRVGDAPKDYDESISIGQPVGTYEEVPTYIVSTHCQMYDVVIVDPGPSRHRNNDAWLYASNGAIAPVPAEALPKRGAANLLRIIKQSNLKRATFKLTTQADLLGIVISKIIVGQEADAQEFKEMLDSKRIPRFETLIPFTMATCKAPEDCLPVGAYAPEDAGAKAFASFGKEVEMKIRA